MVSANAIANHQGGHYQFSEQITAKNTISVLTQR